MRRHLTWALSAGVYTHPFLDEEVKEEDNGEEDQTFNIGDVMDRAGRLPDCAVIFL